MPHCIHPIREVQVLAHPAVHLSCASPAGPALAIGARVAHLSGVSGADGCVGVSYAALVPALFSFFGPAADPHTYSKRESTARFVQDRPDDEDLLAHLPLPLSVQLGRLALPHLPLLGIQAQQILHPGPVGVCGLRQPGESVDLFNLRPRRMWKVPGGACVPAFRRECASLRPRTWLSASVGLRG
jgi:hypothetical protein